MNRRHFACAAALVAVLAAGCTRAQVASERAGEHSPSPTASVITSTSTTSPTTGVTNEAAVVEVRYKAQSRVEDVSTGEFAATVAEILDDSRGWTAAGFRFVADAESPLLVVLAEPAEVDRLCAPLTTVGKVSCQNGPVVALNAERWRRAVPHWTAGTAAYRTYLVNHEVGHLIGQRHPRPICPRPGTPTAVMAQQTRTFAGCAPNPWPRPWEIALAARRPVVLAPLPDWAPGPPPTNPGT